MTAFVYANEKLLKDAKGDEALQQVANVAHLPGIVKYSLAMPDLHWGYGFVIGGVAATDPQADGVVSPGGIGYDINCGVRLIRTNLDVSQLDGKRKELVAKFIRERSLWCRFQRQNSSHRPRRAADVGKRRALVD